MKPASKHFTGEQIERINQAVAAAEAKTSAEIVPVVATASGRYDRAEDLVGLWLGIAALVATYLALPASDAEAGSWGGFPRWQKLLCVIAALVLGFLLGAVVGSRVGWLRRLCTPRRQMRQEVAAAAAQRFYDSRVYRTAGGTGLLMYVSLYERQAMILADEAIVDRLGPSALDALCEHLTASLAADGPTEALCRTIAEAGDRLAGVLSRADDDRNELPDALVVLD